MGAVGGRGKLDAILLSNTGKMTKNYFDADWQIDDNQLRATQLVNSNWKLSC